MKQNLQPPATPLEMLSLFLPAGLLDYFDLVNHVSQETCWLSCNSWGIKFCQFPSCIYLCWLSGFSRLASFLLSV